MANSQRNVLYGTPSFDGGTCLVAETKKSTAREGALDSAQGRLIVALGVCMLTMIWGTVFTFTVYADQLAAAFGLTALQVSSVFSITAAVFLTVGGIFGIFAARFSLRPVLVLIGFGLAMTVVLLQVVDSYVGVVTTFTLLGTAGGGYGLYGHRLAGTAVVRNPPGTRHEHHDDWGRLWSTGSPVRVALASRWNGFQNRFRCCRWRDDPCRARVEPRLSSTD